MDTGGRMIANHADIELQPSSIERQISMDN